VLGHAGDTAPPHGGAILRHFGDGRGVDVHGWSFTDGGNMGVENSVHSDCKGVCYSLWIENGPGEAAPRSPEETALRTPATEPAHASSGGSTPDKELAAAAAAAAVTSEALVEM
jgi:hypothetical protein